MPHNRGDSRSTGKSTLFALIGWLAVSFSASALGALFPPGEWYGTLRKPDWTPPGWVFGPVWTALYAMMGVAAWLVWRRGGFRAQRVSLSLFLCQLALNAAWSPLFFGLRSPLLGLVDIVFLWIALVATIAAFRRVRRLSAWLMMPYLLWVTFAGWLNWTIWRLNA